MGARTYLKRGDNMNDIERIEHYEKILDWTIGHAFETFDKYDDAINWLIGLGFTIEDFEYFNVIDSETDFERYRE